MNGAMLARGLGAPDVVALARDVRGYLNSTAPEGRWDEQRVYAALIEVAPLLSAADARTLAPAVFAHLVGVGPLHSLLSLEGVSDVLINGPGKVWIERHGELVVTDVEVDAHELDYLIERMVAPSGARLDPANPIADARLLDGTRVCVVGREVAVGGPLVALRRFVERDVPLGAFGPPEVCGLIREVIDRQLNVIVFGGTGAGKTSLLNAVGRELPAHERVVIIEDTSELKLEGPGVVRLEARAANAEGAGRITIAQLVKTALRLRPDRLIVGEVRGSEAADLIAALSTGHRGGLSTAHAGSPAEALDRLEEMAMLADGFEGVRQLVRSRLVRAVDVLIGVGRGHAGGRQIFGVWEVAGGGGVGLRSLWEPGCEPAVPSSNRAGAPGPAADVLESIEVAP